MQMVKKIILVFLAIWFALLIFMPKAELYYTLEKELAKNDIKLNEKSIEEGLFSLTIKDVTVYVKGIALAHIDEIQFCTVLGYTTLNIEVLKVDEVLHNKVPASVEKINATHHVLDLLHVQLDSNGSFGVVEGSYDLVQNSMHIEFTQVNEIGTIQPYLTKGEEGWFYEKSF